MVKVISVFFAVFSVFFAVGSLADGLMQDGGKCYIQDLSRAHVYDVCLKNHTRQLSDGKLGYTYADVVTCREKSGLWVEKPCR